MRQTYKDCLFERHRWDGNAKTTRTLRRRADIEVEIDIDKLVDRLGDKATWAAGKKSRLMNGIITVKARNVRKLPEPVKVADTLIRY